MKKIFLMLIATMLAYGQEFKMEDNSIINITETSYGILVNNKYKLKFTNTEPKAWCACYASVYQNKRYKYTIGDEGSNIDVVITDKTTNTIVNSGTYPFYPDVVAWVQIYKNGKFFDTHSGCYKLEDCESIANKYNNDKKLKSRGFRYIITKEPHK